MAAEEIYHPWLVEEILDKMAKQCDKEKFYYVGHLLDKHKLTSGWWSEQKNRADKNRKKTEDKWAVRYQAVYDKFLMLEQKLEANLAIAMLEGRVHATAAIFCLKAKHGWVDRIDHNHEHNVKPISINIRIDDAPHEDDDEEE